MNIDYTNNATLLEILSGVLKQNVELLGKITKLEKKVNTKPKKFSIKYVDEPIVLSSTKPYLQYYQKDEIIGEFFKSIYDCNKLATGEVTDYQYRLSFNGRTTCGTNKSRTECAIDRHKWLLLHPDIKFKFPQFCPLAKRIYDARILKEIEKLPLYGNAKKRADEEREKAKEEEREKAMITEKSMLITLVKKAIPLKKVK